MSLWKLIRSLKYRQMISLIALFARYPFMIVPTAKGTKRCLQISTSLFPKKHQLNGRANAFRHALWNILIAREAIKWNKNPKKALAWAKRITDWHEEFAPNSELAKAMDLHNNATGRELFTKWLDTEADLTDGSIIETLKEAKTTSRKVTGVADLNLYPGELVHIEDD